MRIYLDQKAWDKAETLVRPRLEKDPNNATWAEMLFRLYMAKGEPDRALQYGIDAARNGAFREDFVDFVPPEGAAIQAV